MALPRSLAVNLQRFQASTMSYVKIPFQRSSYTVGDTATVNFPLQGVVDLSTLAITGKIRVKNNSGAGRQFNLPEYYSEIIRKLELLAGGTQIGLSGENDYGRIERFLHTYSQTKEVSDYRAVLGCEGDPTPGTATNLPDTEEVSFPVNMNNLHGFLNAGLGVRYLPLELLPNLVLNLQLHSQKYRWFNVSGTPNENLLIFLEDLSISYMKVDFMDNLLTKLMAERISRSPLPLPFVNFTQYTASSYTTDATVLAQISTQSLDYIICQNLINGASEYPSAMASTQSSEYTGKTKMTEFMPTETHQITINNVPVYSQPVARDTFSAFLSASVEADSGVVFAPNVEDPADLIQKKWAFITRLKFATEPISDGVSWVSGLSTYGQLANATWNITGGDSGETKVPHIIFVHTSVVEVGAGRQIAVIN